MIRSKKKDGLKIPVFVTGCLVVLLAVPSSAWLSQEYLDQIDSSRAAVREIKDVILNGDQKHQTFDRLAILGEKFTTRICGSQELEDSVDYIAEEMKKENFSNVHFEDVTALKWTRGKEFAEILEPLRRPMSIMSLGSSVGTEGNLTAPIIVVKTFDELRAKPREEVEGKIVVYNQAWQGYGASNQYRSKGASEASLMGAVGALVRSITDFSIYSPHTGQQDYYENITKIPVACITVEDAEMLQRYQDRNIPVTVSMITEPENLGQVTTRNLVAEIPGSVHPDEVVIFGGHIDAWDVGTGSMDDGGGVMISWQALSVIKKLDLVPKRTLRVVLWTCEEFGLIGGEAYYNAHKEESGKVSLIMESDHGVFNPYGLHFNGSGLARAIMEEILKDLNDINTTTVLDGDGDSSDTGWWVEEKKVPGVELYSANEKYFYFHHSDGDTMTVLDKDQLDRATILWATAAYAVANLDGLLPREGGYPTVSASIKLSVSYAVSAITTALITYQLTRRQW